MAQCIRGGGTRHGIRRQAIPSRRRADEAPPADLRSERGPYASGGRFSMRWTPGDNPDVEDRRGSSGGGGGVGMYPRLGRGGFVVVLLLSLVFHRNFFALLGGGAPADSTVQQGNQPPASESPQEHT